MAVHEIKPVPAPPENATPDPSTLSQTENVDIDVPRSLKELDKVINDETEVGFAIKGSQLLEVFKKNTEAKDEYSPNEEELEVEKMLLDWDDVTKCVKLQGVLKSSIYMYF